MILKMIPEKTWNPWNPVMKKKKSAKMVFPYSFTSRLAPSTTSLVLASSNSAFSLDNIVFCFLSKSINSVLIWMSGLASKELITCAIEYCAIVACSSNYKPFFLVCCSLTSPLSPTTKSAKAICFPLTSTNCNILPSVVFTAP